MGKAPDVSDDDDYSKNEYLDLPDDPEEAFAALHRRKYKELEEMWESQRSSSWYSERRYVLIIWWRSTKFTTLEF